MITLFITDLDGCISTPFKTPDWELLSRVRRLNKQSKSDIAVPPLSICSGRPLPYVEAVTQWLSIEQPVVFESAGIFELSTNKVIFSPIFDEEAEQQINELKDWLQREVIDHHPGMMIEFTKRMDAGLIHPEKEIIDEVYPVVVDYISEFYPLFEAHKTDVSVNIILSKNNKRDGIQKICEWLEIDPAEVAYIGDSSGDIPGLKMVGTPFAPANAHDSVKEHARVLSADTTQAVLMAYRRVIEENRKALAAAE